MTTRGIILVAIGVLGLWALDRAKSEPPITIDLESDASGAWTATLPADWSETPHLTLEAALASSESSEGTWLPANPTRARWTISSSDEASILHEGTLPIDASVTRDRHSPRSAVVYELSLPVRPEPGAAIFRLDGYERIFTAEALTQIEPRKDRLRLRLHRETIPSATDSPLLAVAFGVVCLCILAGAFLAVVVGPRRRTRNRTRSIAAEGGA